MSLSIIVPIYYFIIILGFEVTKLDCDILNWNIIFKKN